EVALGVTLVVRAAVGRPVVALLARIDDSVATGAGTARHAVRRRAESAVRGACRATLERADVAARSLGPAHVALVRRLTGRISAPGRRRVARIEGRTARKQRVREGRTAVVLEGPEVRALVEEVTAGVAVEAATHRVHDQVEAPRRQVPLAIGTSVVRQDGVHEDHHALVVDARERVRRDGGVVQRRGSGVGESAADVVCGVAADSGIAQLRGAGVRDAAAGAVRDVPAYGAAHDLEHAAIVVDAASRTAGLVAHHGALHELQGAALHPDAGTGVRGAVLDGDAADHRGTRGQDVEHAIERLAVDDGRGSAVTG